MCGLDGSTHGGLTCARVIQVDGVGWVQAGRSLAAQLCQYGSSGVGRGDPGGHPPVDEAVRQAQEQWPAPGHLQQAAHGLLRQCAGEAKGENLSGLGCGHLVHLHLVRAGGQQLWQPGGDQSSTAGAADQEWLELF
ncbi:hypothetical protein ACFQ10_13025 [Streptomyces indonesiensis]